MKSNNDHPRQVLDDFLAWLKQNDADGSDWFLDEGPPASATVPHPPVDGPAAAQKPSPVPTPQPAVVPETQNSPPAQKDPFDLECQAFVAQTLASIRGQGGLPAPVAGAESAAALAELKEEVMPCTQCALHEGRNRVVFGSGNPSAGVLFIGEAPGRDEDLQGEPFVGRSGQLLTKIIEAIGLTREDVYICNILKCRPPNNRDPLPAEVACCEPFLKQQLAIIGPRVICCLGRVAAQTLLKTDASLRTLRSTVHFYENIPVMATYHPAALLRNPGWKRDTWNDVRKLRTLHDALRDQG